MINFIVPYKNALITRKENTIGFLEMMENCLEEYPENKCFICDYGSTDGILELIDSYSKIEYVYTKPNPDDFLNMSKCFNNVVYNYCHPDSLVAPLGIDFRMEPITIKYINNFFEKLGIIILRLQLNCFDKEGYLTSLVPNYTPYVLHRQSIIIAHGWDERIFEWGKEDDDILTRIVNRQKIVHISVLGVGYDHVWHDRSWAESGDKSNYAYKICYDNDMNDGKNMVNTYW